MSRFTRWIVLGVFTWALVGGAAAVLNSSAAVTRDETPRAKFELYKDKGGEFRWRLRATNSQILAMSADSYKAKRDAQNAIESVKKDVANAPIEDLTEGQRKGDGDSRSDSDKPPVTNAKRPTK